MTHYITKLTKPIYWASLTLGLPNTREFPQTLGPNSCGGRQLLINRESKKGDLHGDGVIHYQS